MPSAKWNAKTWDFTPLSQAIPTSSTRKHRPKPSMFSPQTAQPAATGSADCGNGSVLELVRRQLIDDRHPGYLTFLHRNDERLAPLL